MLNGPFVIVDFVAPIDILRTRVQQRREAGVDASEADIHVLEHQLRVADPITPGERESMVIYDAGARLEQSQVDSWQPVLDRLRA